jgi:hypothetical protein
MSVPVAAGAAQRIDEIVAAVPGVVECYAAAPIVTRVVQRLAEPEGALSHVRETGTGREVTVSIGVSVDDNSAVVAAAVAAAVVADAAPLPVSVKVRVSRFVASA